MTISGSGGWYANQYASPMGVGAVAVPDPGAGEDALREALASGPAYLVTPWASQEGSLDWSPLEAEWNLLVAPVNDAQIEAAKVAAFGHPVNWVAVLTSRPVAYETAQSAFESSRYELVGADAVYRQDDPKASPTIYFLYWAELRGDTSGGTTSLDAVAQRLGGMLVFPSQVPLSGQLRPAPALPFQATLDLQLAAGNGAKSVTAPAAPGPAPVAPGARTVPWGAVVLTGAAAVAGGVWAVRAYRRRRAEAR